MCRFFGEMKPSCLYRVRVVKSVVMECLGDFCKDQPLKDFENVAET